MIDIFKEKKKDALEIMNDFAELLEKKSQEFYDDKSHRRTFILSIAINLLGNLAMHLSDDSFDSKFSLANDTIENLRGWYTISLSDYKTKKEIH